MTLRHQQHLLLNLFMILLGWNPILAKYLPLNDTSALDGIKIYMNSSQNPCDNIYEYACGNWMNGNGYNEDEQIRDATVHLEQSYNYDIMEMLEDGSKSDKPETNEIFTKLHNFYESCKKEKVINLTQYLDIIKPTDEDEWPQDGESWTPKSKWSIWSSMGKLATYGFNQLFFDFHIELSDDLTHYLVKLESNELPMAQIMFVQKQISETTGKKARMWKKVINFMEKVKNLYHQTHEREGYGWPMEMDEVKKHFPDMVLFFSNYLGAGKMEAISRIDNRISEFLHRLLPLIASTPQDVLIHTLKQSFSFYLSQQMPAKKSNIACADILRKLLPLAVDYTYGEELYGLKNKRYEAAVEKIFDELKMKLSRKIKTEEFFLTDEGISDFSEKILNMNLRFGNLPPNVEDQFYVDYFQSWEVVMHDFYGNHLNALKRRYFDSLELLKLQEFAPLFKESRSAETTPSYRYTSNVVVLPFAYNRDPMVNDAWHPVLMYAGLGSSLAHAMLKSIDYEGSRYDKDGNIFSVCNIANDNGPCQNHMPRLTMSSLCILTKSELNPIEADRKTAVINAFRLAFETYFKLDSESNDSVDTREIIKEINSQKQAFFVKYAPKFCFNPDIYYPEINGSDMISLIWENYEKIYEIFSCPQRSNEETISECMDEHKKGLYT